MELDNFVCVCVCVWQGAGELELYTWRDVCPTLKKHNQMYFPTC